MSANGTYALSARLAVFVAFLCVPSFLLSLYLADLRREQELSHVRAQAMLLAESIASQQAQLFDRVRMQFARLTGDLQALTGEGCGERLQGLQLFDPHFTQFAVADPAGTIICAASESAGSTVSDRPYFQTALAQGNFALSDVLEGRITKRWTVVAAQPVLQDHLIRAVLIASLDIQWTQALLMRLQLPEHSIVSLSDRNGRILARVPEPEKFVGRQILEAASFRAATGSQTSGFAESAGLDGVARVIAFARIPDTSLFVRVGIPTTEVKAAGSSALQAGLFTLIATVVCTALFGWAGSRRLLLSPIARLAGAAEKLGRGDWTVRTGIDHRGQIVGRLAAKLDELAHYGQSMTRAFRTLSAGNRTLLRESDESALLEAMCRVAVMHGGYRLAFVNYIRHDDAKTIETVACHGDGLDFVETLRMTWADSERGRGSVGTAIREGKHNIIRSLATDPRFAPWREEAVKRRYGSIISLPLRVEGEVIGTFTLIAEEEDAFDEGEVNLLDEMAADLSFGIQIARAAVQQKEHRRIADYALTHDNFTGLPNRVSFLRDLTACIEMARQAHEPLAVLVIHMPRLQELFDGFGYNPSLAAVRQIADRLAGIPEFAPTLARLAPNEFGLILPHVSPEITLQHARTALAAFQDPVLVGEAEIDLAAFIGISYFPGHGDEADALVRRAAIAARSGVRRDAGIFVYEGATERENPERLAIAAELRTAIKRRELELHYQPKFNLSSGRISGAEALVRWNHPKRGFLPPAKFVPLAEDTGLIRVMTEMVIAVAVRQQHAWVDRGIALPVAVNLSANNLYDPRFFDTFQALLETWGVQASLIEIELTESALVDDPETARRVLERLRQFGCKIYIDDFGTGYSSLNYLVTLPVHALKIDRSFVHQMSKSREAHSVVASIISMAHNLGLRVVAEGVETAEDLEMLRQLGCDEAQGYYFAKPLPAEQYDGSFLRQPPG
jgi:diguanylate cyclase (GGDEF)-like protein